MPPKPNAPSTVEERLAATAPTLPQFCTVTYSGTIYLRAGKNGTDTSSFGPTTVKVSHDAIANPESNPEHLFRTEFYELISGAQGPHSFQYVYLDKVEGDLPDMPPAKTVSWTTDIDALRTLAKQYGTHVPYERVDLAEDKKYRETVTLDPNLFPTPRKLREALLLILDMPERFASVQQEKQRKQDPKAAGIREGLKLLNQ